MISENAQRAHDAFQTLQDEICAGLTALDGNCNITEDMWERPGGGGGRSRILKGDVIESGGVNFSAVHGSLTPQAARALGIGSGNFFATGVSIVLHPRNPHTPIIHMNVRYFELEDGLWWFGGGIDLTPHYVVPKLAKSFHQKLKATCDAHECADYEQFRKLADSYFYLRHRKETRGIGGIFYDRLYSAEFEELLDYSVAVGRTFVPAYAEQVEATRDSKPTEQDFRWQQLRRGRYVEFNLVWDRGTKFGLETDGRTESILMSMPPQASWTYNFQPETGSREEETLKYLRNPVDWLEETDF